MNRMNRRELEENVADRCGISKAEARGVAAAVLDTVAEALVSGRGISVTGFGSFEAVDRPARTARDPQTGDPIDVPACKVARFRPGARLKDLMNGRVAIPEDGRLVAKRGKTS